ncbi:MAG TPA: FtsX-like permease family protein, partial [Thermoanaerobaculia bacterium]|nr:FtsX-like permease family protein [Thermoanaerobaculia bacterium]
RGLGRGHEIAIRAALGAGRLRVVRLVGVEALMMAAVGGLLGVLLAVWGLEAVVRWGPSDVPRLEAIQLSWPTLGFTVAVAVGAALLIGLVTAVALLRLTPADSLSSGQRGSIDRGEKRLRGALTVAELALSLILVLGAGLMVRSLWTLLDVDPGFRTEGTAAVQLFAYGDRYDGPEAWRAFTDELLAGVEALPGVEAAGVVTSLPMNVLSGGSLEVQVAGRPEPEAVQGGYRAATPGYFRAMQIPVVAGRSLSAADRADAPPVALVNETAVASWFAEGGTDGALDQRLVVGENEVTIVGVVGDVYHQDLETEPVPEVFFPFAQRPTGTLSLVAATDGDAASLLEPMRAEVWALDSVQPIFRSYVLADLLDTTTAGRRFYTGLLTAFAALAALVAAIGLYGVVSYSVAQRTREIGIRMTLGARTRDVARLVLDQGTRLALAGVVLGLAGGLLLMRLAQGLLYGVSASDPLTVVAVAGLFVALALGSSWLPARRAARIDPITAIRSE